MTETPKVKQPRPGMYFHHNADGTVEQRYSGTDRSSIRAYKRKILGEHRAASHKRGQKIVRKAR